MNRRQRRVALKSSPQAGGPRDGATGDPASQLFAEAIFYQQQNKLNDAARTYKRLLLLKPDHAMASNNLALVLQAQGKLSEASERFARALTLMPQLFDQYQGICATLVSVLPQLGEIVRNAVAAWPKRLPADRLLGSSGFAAVTGDSLLRCMLQSAPVRDVALERTLTSFRAALLAGASNESDNNVLAFCCALARQCFINGYVFATTADEDAQAESLKATVAGAIAGGADISPTQIAVLAMYCPLHALPGADALLGKAWPPAVAGVLTQQLHEPSEERELRATIARLTTVNDDVTRRAQQHSEGAAYPRWVHAGGQIVAVRIDQYLHDLFPTAVTAALAKPEAIEVLAAGCGTGWHAIEIVQKFDGARVLAADLSLARLSYAKRNTPAAVAERIDYARADIFKLESLGRRFDLIDVGGALRHLADPLEGWRKLLSLLRPRGLMRLGLYSELGRSDVAAARAQIAERGYGSTDAELRRCRQDLLDTPQRSIVRFGEFFTASESRDLLFGDREAEISIPAIKRFLAEHGLRFVGFEFGTAILQSYRAQFAANGWSVTDLDKWHATESQYPSTFSGMYQMWVQTN